MEILNLHASVKSIIMTCIHMQFIQTLATSMTKVKSVCNLPHFSNNSASGNFISVIRSDNADTNYKKLIFKFE